MPPKMPKTAKTTKPQSGFDMFAGWIKEATKESSAYSKLKPGEDTKAIVETAKQTMPRHVNSSFKIFAGRKR